MQYSLPVVSTNIGATTDIVKHKATGFIAEMHSPKNLADKISQLLDNPISVQQMGKEGRKRYFEFFTIDKYEDRIKIIFDNILNI